VSFVEDGSVRAVRFRASRGELSWRHDTWAFDPNVRQFLARDTVVVAQNAKYRVSLKLTIGDRQAPLLSPATPITDAYVIMEHFPYFEGSIAEAGTGRVIASFRGQGGGELASPRRLRRGGDHRGWSSRHYAVTGSVPDPWPPR
jgi:hypothetical protein